MNHTPHTSMFAASPGQPGRLSPLQPQRVQCPTTLLRLLPKLVRMTPEQRMEEATRDGLTLSHLEQEGLHLILQASRSRQQQLFWWMRLLNIESHPAQVYIPESRTPSFRLYTPLLPEAGAELTPIVRQYLGRRLGCRFLHGLLLLGWLMPEILHQALIQRSHWVITDYFLPTPSALEARPAGLAQQRLRFQFEALLANQPHSNQDLVGNLRRWIRAESNPPTLENAAIHLGFSERSLNRYLAGLGSSFQEEMDQWRCEQALKSLQNSDLDASQISQQLGYDNPANFGRACKRWFGQPAGAIQRELQRSTDT
ncbi:helix-turn-helix domain-containing protein [Parathalassolituus penaei]|uniref:AraC family transcriptional regulator n=1 Tax=Parathalassolituus penaei TaxID=2997323 RepID=A0A9X3E9Z1_9GAMM|nr:AraC family transcriptional regulator [Parathalassolituus penaei]MCY0963602.1 AraC family transcriptional regulator [Parathalassolituus penaei]